MPRSAGLGGREPRVLWYLRFKLFTGNAHWGFALFQRKSFGKKKCFILL